VEQEKQIYKFEIHALADELKSLSFLAKEEVEMVGYYKLRRRRVFLKENQGVNVECASGKQYLSDVIRVDAFIAGTCELLLDKLSSIAAVLDVNVYPCTLNYLEYISDIEGIRVTEDSDQVCQEIPSKVVSGADVHALEWKVVGPQGGKMRITLRAYSNILFLWKVFGVLGLYNVSIANARKYRQNEFDYCTFTINEVNGEVLGEIKNQMQLELLSASVEKSRYTKVSRNVSLKQLDVSSEVKNNLLAIRIRTVDSDSGFRLMVQEVLLAHELDIVLARLTKIGKDINDTYYVSSSNQGVVDPDIASSVNNLLLGIQ